MQQGNVVDLDVGIAIFSAKIGHELKLSLADAVIVAMARRHDAVIWTQGSDLEDVEGVKYVKKR
jgi:predicted nucleic acid-binding protein